MRERRIRRFGDVRASALESSGPFATAVTARQQVGRLVKVLWKTNRELPKAFYDSARTGGWYRTSSIDLLPCTLTANAMEVDDYICPSTPSQRFEAILGSEMSSRRG
jgi:hypothetical protein